MPKVAVFTDHIELQEAAESLAARLGIPLTSAKTDYEFLLIYTPDYLGLLPTAAKSGPLFIDFLSAKLAYRRKHASIRKEIIARALGLKSHACPKILDATAGLGRDSFILATLGFEVQLIERSPIVNALLEDAIQRALKDPSVAIIVKRMQLVQANAIDWMNNQADRPDIIYLDPMFPERTKSALVKKEMQIFHSIIGDDDDADELLKAALACATKRVVVKRPRLSAHLAGLVPSYDLTGSSNRFDIYLV